MALGLDVPEPPEPENPAEYDYETCPFFGDLPVRGQVLEGTVVSTDMDRTVVVEREYEVTVPKYDRLMKRRSRIPAHVPEVLEPLSVGDAVKIAETRPLSKTKHHVVVAVLDSEVGPSGEETHHATPTDEETTGDVPTDGGEA